LDFDGDGAVELITTDPTTPLQFCYSSPGLYRAYLHLTDTSATTADAYIAIEVDVVAVLHATSQAVWTNLHTTLVAGDIATALTFLDGRAQARYAPVAAKIGSNLAEYAVTRMIAGERRLFLIYFIRGVDGVWRLDSM